MYEWEYYCAVKGRWTCCLSSLGYAWFEISDGYGINDRFMVALGVCIYPIRLERGVGIFGI